MMGAVFTQGAQWIRADFHLHTSVDREFKFTGDDNFCNSNYVSTLEKAGISPGDLPNNLTIENIKAGNCNMRNLILASFTAKLLPYRGLGGSLLRALRAGPQIDLIDDRSGGLFKVIVVRQQEQAA
ncbi:hypothetical protein ACQKCL_21840 [Stutzerimonas stutzeri]